MTTVIQNVTYDLSIIISDTTQTETSVTETDDYTETQSDEEDLEEEEEYSDEESENEGGVSDLLDAVLSDDDVASPRPPVEMRRNSTRKTRV